MLKPLQIPRQDGKADLRRKHPHFLVTVAYSDGLLFERVYNNSAKAKKFAERQQRSPVVTKTSIRQIR